jgi:hypothetical protein
MLTLSRSGTERIPQLQRRQANDESPCPAAAPSRFSRSSSHRSSSHGNSSSGRRERRCLLAGLGQSESSLAVVPLTSRRLRGRRCRRLATNALGVALHGFLFFVIRFPRSLYGATIPSARPTTDGPATTLVAAANIVLPDARTKANGWPLERTRSVCERHTPGV